MPLATCNAWVRARVAPAATYGTLVGALSPTTPGAFTPTSGSELGFNATVALDAPTITTVAPTTGDVAGGQQVTITGQHLAVVTGVAFDGVAATISAASNEQRRSSRRPTPAARRS